MSVRQGGLAQLARALALHARGHRFDSDILHQIEIERLEVHDVEHNNKKHNNKGVIVKI